LLDTCLPWDQSLSLALDGAFAVGADLVPGLPVATRTRWSALLERLQGVQWSSLSTTTDGELAERIVVILARRPRLALPPGSGGVVTEVLAAARHGVRRDSEALFAGVAGSLVG
jgi:hypothetical protein